MRLPPPLPPRPVLLSPSSVLRCGAPTRCGFTLIELLTVIAIIGILAAILIPTISRVRQSAHAAACASNLRQIGSASLLWAADNRGRMPGSGRMPNETGVSWHTVLNHGVFPSYNGTAGTVLQRSGDEPKSGQLYCPSIERWSSNSNQQTSVRAYVINAHVNLPAGSPDVGPFGAFAEYRHGAIYNTFSSPARVFLVWDSEMTTDLLRVNAAANLPGGEGRIVWDNRAGDTSQHMSPASANNRAYSFRHGGGNMNMLFLDGHVAKLTPDRMGPLHVVSSFHD